MVVIGMRLQLSYSCMPNMKSIISSHNKHVLSSFNSPPLQADTYNCRKKPDSPLVVVVVESTKPQ